MLSRQINNCTYIWPAIQMNVASNAVNVDKCWNLVPTTKLICSNILANVRSLATFHTVRKLLCSVQTIWSTCDGIQVIVHMLALLRIVTNDFPPHTIWNCILTRYTLVPGRSFAKFVINHFHNQAHFEFTGWEFINSEQEKWLNWIYTEK